MHIFSNRMSHRSELVTIMSDADRIPTEMCYAWVGLHKQMFSDTQEWDGSLYSVKDVDGNRCGFVDFCTKL